MQRFLIGTSSLSKAKPSGKETHSEADSQSPLASPITHQQEKLILESEIILLGAARQPLQVHPSYLPHHSQHRRRVRRFAAILRGRVEEGTREAAVDSQAWRKLKSWMRDIGLQADRASTQAHRKVPGETPRPHIHRAALHLSLSLPPEEVRHPLLCPSDYHTQGIRIFLPAWLPANFQLRILIEKLQQQVHPSDK